MEEEGSPTNSLTLEVKGAWKEFPGVQALADVSFELRHGEIHAVVGENGAGKTTLMNILSGVHQADRGQILLEGKRISPANPKEAFDLGISIVHQETSLCANLSIAENVFVHRIPTTWGGMVNFRRLNEQTEALLKQFDIKVSPQTRVGRLGIAQQQLVEISKASAYKCKLLILDEPTSTLALHEEAILFDRIRQMKKLGTSVIYISHRLREVFELADRVTVLRDGRLIGTKVVAETDLPTIISMMVGRKISQFFPEKGKGGGVPILQVRHLSSGTRVRDITFDLHRGEILGVAGLVGAGRTETALALFGAAPIDRGEVLVEGKPVHINLPQNAIRLGMGYLPEDRRLWGLFLGMDVQANIISAHLHDFAGRILMKARKGMAEATRFVDALDIRTPSLLQKTLNLSGGNQQKVVVAKWLSTAPKILIADEPTRGIDVGAKAEIHMLLRNLANEGVAILMISSELPEILGMSDRIMVMHEGRVMGVLAGEDATEDAVMSLAVGSHTAAQNVIASERNT